MKRVNTVLEDPEIPLNVKNGLDLTWEELILQGSQALTEKHDEQLEHHDD